MNITDKDFRPLPGTKTYTTYCECNGVYHDEVQVEVDSWPDEEDTNTQAGAEITGVWLDGKYILDDMSDSEKLDLEERMLDRFTQDAEDEYAAKIDYAYEQMKDRKMESGE